MRRAHHQGKCPTFHQPTGIDIEDGRDTLQHQRQEARVRSEELDDVATAEELPPEEQVQRSRPPGEQRGPEGQQLEASVKSEESQTGAESPGPKSTNPPQQERDAPLSEGPKPEKGLSEEEAGEESEEASVKKASVDEPEEEHYGLTFTRSRMQSVKLDLSPMKKWKH